MYIKEPLITANSLLGVEDVTWRMFIMDSLPVVALEVHKSWKTDVGLRVGVFVRLLAVVVSTFSSMHVIFPTSKMEHSLFFF